MAISGIQVINVGLQNESANSDSLYAAFSKTKTNFATLFGNASPFSTFTGNTGIGVTSNASTGTVDITNTGVLNIVAGTGVTIDQANGNVTISSTGGGGGNGGGTVTSVGLIAGSATRLAVSGSPVVSSGNISIDLVSTGVSPGTYTYPTLAVDAYGRVTSASNGTSVGTVTSVGITPGFGIQVTGSPVTTSGVMTIQNTGVTRVSAGSGISVSGSNGNVTISATTSSGTVSYVGVTSNSLNVSGGPITTSGSIDINLPSNLNSQTLNNFSSKEFVNQPQSLFYGSQVSSSSGICISSDGLTVLVTSSSSTIIYKYTLSVAWSLNSGTYSGQSFNVSAQTSNVRSIRLSPDGTKFFICSSTTDAVLQYTMSTAYNLTTATYTSSVSISGQENEGRGIDFKPDGLKLYVLGFTNKKIYQYNLGSAWDISTASYSGSVSPTLSSTAPQGLVFNPTGTKVFIADQNGGAIQEFALSSAWDVTTISLTTSMDRISYYESVPTDIALNNDGTQIYIAGGGTPLQRVWAFSFSTPYSVALSSSYLPILGSTINQFGSLVVRDSAGNIAVQSVNAAGDAVITGKIGVSYTYTDTALVVGKLPTASANAWGIISEGNVTNTITGSAYYNSVYSYANSNVSVGNVFGYFSAKGTWGSNVTVGTQHGFFAASSLTGAGNNFGFTSNLAAAANTYNFYAIGTAQNRFSGDVVIFGAGGLGYMTGSGGTITQVSNRTTGVTLNKTNGTIVLASEAGSASWQTFTVTNSTVAATDVIRVCQQSGTDKYMIHVTAVSAGSFAITFATTGGTTTEQPVFNFAVIKAVNA